MVRKEKEIIRTLLNLNLLSCFSRRHLHPTSAANIDKIRVYSSSLPPLIAVKPPIKTCTPLRLAPEDSLILLAQHPLDPVPADLTFKVVETPEISKVVHDSSGLVLFTRRATAGESAESATERGAHGDEQCNGSANCEPTGDAEFSSKSSTTDIVSDQIPKDHINNKDDQRGKCAKSSKEGHHDGSESGCGANTNQTEYQREKGDTTGDGVKDEGGREVAKDKLVVEGNVGRTTNDQVITN